MKILIIDDEASLRRTLRTTLETMSHHVTEARHGAEALELTGRMSFDLAFLDLRLGSDQGLELLPELLRLAPITAIVVVTAYATIETAVEAMRRGASDYLPKPFTPAQVRLAIDRVERLRLLEGHVQDLQSQVRAVVPEADLQTAEPTMQQALDMAMKAAPSEASLLLRGESGTGKGVLARMIHAHSNRSNGPFITVHSPSLSPELLESELFGHQRGSFTGAVRDTIGKVDAAAGGTLFLDEVGELSPVLQPKLLRLLQEKRFERVGDTQSRASDVRILAATNRDLEADTAAGRFREDLLYRLNVIEIKVPPLRERRQDIVPLAQHLLAFFARQRVQPLTAFAEEARAAMLRHHWPGNVRELRNAVERAAILAPGPLVEATDLPGPIVSPGRNDAAVAVGNSVTLEALEAEHIRRILGSGRSNEECAGILGIDVSTLYRKRKRYGF